MQQQVPNQQTTTQLDTVRFRVWAWLLLATILLGRRLPPDQSKDLYALQDNRRIMEKFGGLAARLTAKDNDKDKDNEGEHNKKRVETQTNKAK